MEKKNNKKKSSGKSKKRKFKANFQKIFCIVIALGFIITTISVSVYQIVSHNNQQKIINAIIEESIKNSKKEDVDDDSQNTE